MDTTEPTTTLLELLKKARVLLRVEVEDELREILPSIYRVHNYSTRDRPLPTVECGSVRLSDTARCLYRALFLFGPTQLSFANMYKDCLFALCSPDWKLVADFEFYKYEAALYFSASEDHVEGSNHSIVCGLPGSDNGVRFKGETATEFFSLLTDLLNREWEVYSGNDFRV